METKSQTIISRIANYTFLICVFSLCFFYSTHSYSEITKTKLWVLNYDQFIARKILIDEGFYMPKANLIKTKASVSNWTKKFSDQFGYTQGHNVIFHFQTRFFSQHSGVIDPTYAVQLNLEIPESELKKHHEIPLSKIKGYFSWIHPDFPDSNLFLPLSKGHLKIFSIEDKILTGHINVKFNRSGKYQKHSKDPIHVYGQIKIPYQNRQAYSQKQNYNWSEIQRQAAMLDDMPVDKDRLKPRYEYRKRDVNRWIQERDSSSWH